MITDLEEERQPPMSPRSRRLPRALMVLIALVAVATLASGVWYSRALSGSADGKPVTFVVEEGATARGIAEELEARGIIRSSFAMLLHLRVNGKGAELKPGVYQLSEDLGVEKALAKLLQGVPLQTVRFTIPEGKTLQEVADIIDANTGISREQFMKAAKSPKHRPSFLPSDVTTLEGVLFPDTYELRADSSAHDAVSIMVRRMEDVLSSLPTSEAKRLGVSIYEAVIIASMIEREARIERDRPLVSSVIYNRLDIPMRLQIDATVQYALFRRDGKYAEIVLFRDLEIDSPYNTYKNDGLPPTPIAMPGQAALRAALAPAQTEFLYYVACGSDGGHAFGRTGSDHERNVNRCQ